MISWDPFSCPVCRRARYQRVVFIGGEFSYQCPECRAVHCFFETLYYRFQETWLHPANRRRFVGSYVNGGFVEASSRPEDATSRIRATYTRLCRKWEQAELDRRDRQEEGGFQVRSLTGRPHRGRFFVASALHDHFNEAFRGIVRMREHLLCPSGNATYNILLAFDGGPLAGIIGEIEAKLPGLDEIWLIDYDRTLRWPYAGENDEIDRGTLLNLAVTHRLDGLEGIGEVISKRPGPFPLSRDEGVREIRRLVEPATDHVLKSTRGCPLDGCYVAIILHQDDHRRAGINRPEQVAEATDLIHEHGERAFLLIVDKRPETPFQDIPGLAIARFTDLSQQAQFFRDHCKAVIGTNSSGCNLPALYGCPILAFVKGRPFPDDFYCFGRLASSYQAGLPWHGDLEKTDNIVEVPVDPGQPTRPQDHAERVRQWFRECVPSAPDYRGADEMRNGFRSECPGCHAQNRSRLFRLTGSDLCVEFACDHCAEPFVSYRGLTTASEIDVLLPHAVDTNRRLKRYLGVPPGSGARLGEGGGAVTRVSRAGSHRTGGVAFYCMKPSLSDLYYMLPSLFQIREDQPDARLVAVIPCSHRPLIPEGLCDELWLVDVDPYLFDESDYSPVHAELEKLLEIEEIETVTSNYPGSLPFGRNTYRHLRDHFAPDKPAGRDIDVVIYCRLGPRRQWPSAAAGAELCERLEQRTLTYTILTFPSGDRAALPEWLQDNDQLEIDPPFDRQLHMLARSRVCVTPHGASEVPASIAASWIVELESDPPHWRDPTPQPIRYGFDPDRFHRVTGPSLQEIGVARIVDAIELALDDGRHGERPAAASEQAGCVSC